MDRIGTPDQLAAAAAIAYRQRHVSLRQGLVTYAVFPVLLPIVIWFSLISVVYVIAAIFDPTDPSEPSDIRGTELKIANVVNTGLILLPIAFSSIMFGRLARKNGVDWRWPLLTTCLLAGFAGLFFSTAIPWGPHEQRLALIVGLPSTIQQALHSLVILAVGVWSCRRGCRIQVAV